MADYTHPPARPRAIRVLVVDDNADAADTLASLLELWGYEARVAYDGPSGLGAAAAWEPDCVMLDITMPGMDGYEVARQMRASPATNRVLLVALSAYSDRSHIEQTAAAGFDRRLTKPAAAADIAEVLAPLDGR